MAVKSEYRGPLTAEKLAGLDGPSAWTLAPDGKQVAFIQDQGGIKHIWSVSLDGGFLRRLTAERKDCAEPAWSPDSRKIAFVRDNALVVMDADGTNARVLWKHKSGIAHPRWAPNGQMIAFSSRQRGWSQIWTLDLDGRTPRCLTPEPHNYESLEWSPDSSSIVATTTSAHDLWNNDIYLFPVGGGEQRLMSRPGSLDYAPFWSPDGTYLTFISDRNERPHIWRVELESGNDTQLTFGPDEDGTIQPNRGVAAHISPDGRWIAFVRNRDAHFDLMVMASDGGEPRRLGTRDGVYEIVGWFPDSSAVLAVFQSPSHAPTLTHVPLDGAEQDLSDGQIGLAPDAFIQPDRVRYTSRDGLEIAGWLWRPKAEDATPIPAIVYPHGGPTSQVLALFRPLLSLLAQEGFAVLAPDFRGSTGYGNKFRQANFGEWGHADLFDVVDGADWLKHQAWVDPERVGIFGGSYGGYMVLCALAFAPEVFACGVDLFGDSEIAESYRHGDRVGRLDLERQMGSPDDQPDLYRRGSPLYAAERIEAPLLILHGRDDMRVVPLMSEKMIEALKIEGKYHEAHFYDGEGHGFNKPENKQDYIERTLKFLKCYLMNEQD